MSLLMTGILYATSDVVCMDCLRAPTPDDLLLGNYRCSCGGRLDRPVWLVAIEQGGVDDVLTLCCVLTYGAADPATLDIEMHRKPDNTFVFTMTGRLPGRLRWPPMDLLEQAARWLVMDRNRIPALVAQWRMDSRVARCSDGRTAALAPYGNGEVVPDNTEGTYAVVWQGRTCTPRWLLQGAAQAYLDALRAGTRKPEYSEEVPQ